ncbi:MAG: Ig-like domain-containing protein [Acidobacteria bacterium]|nr:Ig-like domain-containing protein [Acidobacteriota bacterium]
MKTHTGRSTAIRNVDRTALAALVLVTALVLAASPAVADSTPQTLPFSQNWANTGLITTNDVWTGVAGIEGFRGDGITGSTGVDPQTLLAADDPGVLDVNANQTNPLTFTTGGATEFELTNPVVALAGSGTADAPYLKLYLNTTGATGVTIHYNVRDIEAGPDDAVQQVALHYRVGATGTFTNVAGAYVADATTTGTDTQVTNVCAVLPAAADNLALVQVRIMTTNAAGNDEFVGIDDILVDTAGCTPADAAPEVSSTTPTNGATGVALASNIDITFSEPVNVTGTWFTISCASSGAHTATVTGGPTTFTLDPDSDFVNDETCTVTVEADLVTDQDTNDPPDNMAADYAFSFTTVAIVPALSIDDVTVTEGDGGTVTASFTVSSVPAPTGTVTFDYATADGTTNPATAGSDYVAIPTTSGSIDAANPTFTINVTVNGDTALEPNETFFVNLSNPAGATIGDGQGVGTITNDDFTPIHDIQGPGLTSPLSGSVTTQGIVTARKSNGFFIQAPEAEYDADPTTSEGIYDYTTSAPPADAAVGARVQVVGTISDFVPPSDPLQAPVTELTGPVVTQLSTGNALPGPIVLTAADTPPGSALEVLERFEGMRVTADSFTVVAGNLGNLSEANATSTARNYFWATITGVARPFRETGIEVPNPVLTCAAGSGCAIPSFDSNAEIFEITSTGQTGAALIDTRVGATLTGLVGPLDYTFRFWTIYPDPSPAPVVTGGITPTTVPAASTFEFTVASWNLQRFYDTFNDPATSDVQLTAIAYANRLNKASLAIRNSMNFPDIIAVAEAESAGVLADLAAKIDSDAVANSQPVPSYMAHLAEGNDIGGIDVGFLIKRAIVHDTTPRVAYDALIQENQAETWIDPSDNLPHLLNDRPPLRLSATVHHPNGSSFAVTVIANHLRSLNGIEDETPDGLTTVGNRVRQKRNAQAVSLANLVQARQIANPAERIIVLGDFNAFQISDGYVDVMATIKGTPTANTQVVVAASDLVNPNLTNLTESVPAADRYSYLYNGDAQTIDHILVNGALMSSTVAQRLEHPRICADFNDTARNDPNTALRLSDHDPVVAYFEVATFPVELASFSAE